MIFYCISDEVKIRHSETKNRFGDLIKRRSLWTIGIIVLFSAGANMGIYLITPLYLTKELLLSIDYANTILGISRFGGIGVAIFCGFLADKISLRKIMFIMVLISGILTVLLRDSSCQIYLGCSFVTGAFCDRYFPSHLCVNREDLQQGSEKYGNKPCFDCLQYMRGRSNTLSAWSFR